ncbi:MAG TPA: MBL fold metallo-hydrolase [Gemmatales bacterium]|nr:MBL fold metallo-hydrolase [Gemmatales bacterium]
MKLIARLGLYLGILALFFVVAVAGQQGPLKDMKFNEVKEIAPGVFFRYSSISATDLTVPFGGSNHAWVIFKDYVVVIDANFPKEAGDVIAAIKKTTDKPIRYVLDTHHHGDHAYGNAVWAKEGAKIVGHRACSRLLQTSGPKQWDDAAKGRKDVAESSLKQVDISFDDKYVLDDGTQRVEFLFLGHAHTPGDSVAYLPRTRSSALAMPASTGRSTSWATPTLPPGSRSLRSCKAWMSTWSSPATALSPTRSCSTNRNATLLT